MATHVLGTIAASPHSYASLEDGLRCAVKALERSSAMNPARSDMSFLDQMEQVRSESACALLTIKPLIKDQQ